MKRVRRVGVSLFTSLAMVAAAHAQEPVPAQTQEPVKVLIKITSPGGLIYSQTFQVAGEGGFAGSERVAINAPQKGIMGSKLQLSGRVFVNEQGKVQYQVGCWEERRVLVGKIYTTERGTDLFSGVLDNPRHVGLPRMGKACSGVAVDVSIQPLP